MYDVVCIEPGHRMKVRWSNGSFEFTVSRPGDKTNLAQGGADNELPHLADLIAATLPFVDWAREGLLKEQLAADALADYDPYVRAIVLAR